MGFTWQNYDHSFIKAVITNTDMIDHKELVLKTDDQDILVAFMNEICDYPNDKFIMRYKGAIDNYLLPSYPDQVDTICRTLGLKGRSSYDKLKKLQKEKVTPTLARAYIAAMLNISGFDIPAREYSSFKDPKCTDLRQVLAQDLSLYDFQQEAVNKLTEHFIKKDNHAGMLVLPTGSGKTRTATYFLLKELVSQGYQVIWLAHRYMLIDQAADTLWNNVGLMKLGNSTMKNFALECVSSEHRRLAQIDEKDTIVVASINSVCRNKEHLKRILGKKVILVVDECHHALAPSYRDTIKFLKKHKRNIKLLGLTATPVRANDEESIKLCQMFDNNIVYSVSMSDLIVRHILAKPEYIRIDTGENFEPIISEEEARWINRHDDLPESLVNKIALSKARNKVIVGDYLANKETYGKTLIFAMNVVHCRLLCEELRGNNVRCDCIYSGNDNNTAIIKDFKENKLDVLVNVNIMTEGTDVPDIQTVMLTRPTQSEGFLMQMIGRGMRGPKADKGTETVNIVDFHDKWEVFDRWLNPKWVLEDEGGIEPKKPQEKYHYTYTEYEWQKCLDAYNSFIFDAKKLNRYIMVPAGWYSLIDEDTTRTLLVFENQLKSYTKMISDKAFWVDGEASIAAILKKYFNNFVDAPRAEDLQLFIENYRFREEKPTFHPFAERKKIDPFYVAKAAKADGMDFTMAAEEAYEAHPKAAEIYKSKEDYIQLVVDAAENSTTRTGQRIPELPITLIDYDSTPLSKTLNKLMQEVIDERFDGNYPGISEIRWTDKPYKAFFGRFHLEEHWIEINRVLDSISVGENHIKFLIYHELLHRDNPYHDAAFKECEMEYPNAAEHEAFFKKEMNKFDIIEW